MTTTAPTPPNDDQTGPTVTDDYRKILAANLDDPAAYWALLASLMSLYLGMIAHQHRRCVGCRTCDLLTEVTDLARAHNSLQTFNEVLEIDEPYSLLSHITPDRTPTTNTGATA
ncbi:hypothetical protein ACWEOZ_15405 [Actinoplanes sp. NPDC004185]